MRRAKRFISELKMPSSPSLTVYKYASRGQATLEVHAVSGRVEEGVKRDVVPGPGTEAIPCLLRFTKKRCRFLADVVGQKLQYASSVNPTRNRLVIS